MADSMVMDPNQSPQLGSHDEPGSHLQFQISLLRLMDQKWTDQKGMDPKGTVEGASGQKAELKVGPALQARTREVPSVQVIELERLQLRAG